MKKLLIPSICFVIGLATGTCHGHYTGHGKSEAARSADTVFMTDTLTVVAPAAVDSVKLHPVARRLPIAAPSAADTIHDTVTVMVPMTSYRYVSPLYEAVVSGYEARLDSITVYPQTTIITRRPKRWNISVGAGACVTRHGIEPGINIGVSYSLFSF